MDDPGSSGVDASVPLAVETDGSDPEVRAVRRELFGDRDALMTRYADWLVGAGVERGLIGPREAPRVWRRHILNCAAIEAVIPVDADVLDVGSGAGLPGIVLAVRRPDLKVTLLEPLARRVAFLTEVVEDLALANIEVVRGRAEELAGKRLFGVVTARAVAPLDRLARWTLPLLRLDGCLVAVKGASAGEEVEKHRKALKRVGAEQVTIEECGVGAVDKPTTVVVVRKDGPRK